MLFIENISNEPNSLRTNTTQQFHLRLLLYLFFRLLYSLAMSSEVLALGEEEVRQFVHLAVVPQVLHVIGLNQLPR